MGWGGVKVGIKANSAQPTELKLDSDGRAWQNLQKKSVNPLFPIPLDFYFKILFYYKIENVLKKIDQNLKKIFQEVTEFLSGKQ